MSPPLPRSFLNNGYVGNARWRGAPLRAVLERAGVKPEAHDVVLEGADRGKPEFAPAEVAYAKGIPIDKALHPETLVVYEMNGARPCRASTAALWAPSSPAGTAPTTSSG